MDCLKSNSKIENIGGTSNTKHSKSKYSYEWLVKNLFKQ